MVCPLVQQLKSFYDYALSLEKAVCDILVILCLPTMAAIEHLEKQQVSMMMYEDLDVHVYIHNVYLILRIYVPIYSPIWCTYMYMCI